MFICFLVSSVLFTSSDQSKNFTDETKITANETLAEIEIVGKSNSHW